LHRYARAESALKMLAVGAAASSTPLRARLAPGWKPAVNGPAHPSPLGAPMILVLGASSASGPTLRPSRPRHIRYPRDTAQIRTMLWGYVGNWRAMARRGIVEARDLRRPAELPARKALGRTPRCTYGLEEA